ncbi:MAG: dipicolinate synthase subunit DpsA [Syntrophomonadaceae bacterium]|nr:dipicolinate synthase subunit DpsA [Syntrophomonadaceae bacterium]
MSSALSGVKIAVLGGDDRELILVAELVTLGATVTVVGFPREKIKHGAFVSKSIEDGLRGAEVAICPLLGTDRNGVIRAIYTEEQLLLTEKALNGMTKPALVIIGSARPFLRDWAAKGEISLLEIIEMDEIAILNSIPTAEGALQIAMQELKTTIHGSRSMVLGFGRVGVTLGRMLRSLGSDVSVVSNQQSELARAYEMGCTRVPLELLEDRVSSMTVVFNTVPAAVLTGNVLRRMSPDTLIIDLASTPGGTDFETANEYGIKALLAPGLPGKVAPVMAGGILAEVIPRLIIEKMFRPEEQLLLA